MLGNYGRLTMVDLFSCCISCLCLYYRLRGLSLFLREGGCNRPIGLLVDYYLLSMLMPFVLVSLSYLFVIFIFVYVYVTCLRHMLMAYVYVTRLCHMARSYVYVTRLTLRSHRTIPECIVPPFSSFFVYCLSPRLFCAFVIFILHIYNHRI